jgi:hypothetical protein
VKSSPHLPTFERFGGSAIAPSNGAMALRGTLWVMGELFVDLVYRGLPLGSGIRLTQIQARRGYLEISAPMPVGSGIAMHVDGIIIGAHVIAVHEQTTVSERPPGMLVQPLLDSEAAIAWWAVAGGLPVQALRAVRDPAPSPAAIASVPPSRDSAASIVPTVSAFAATVDAAAIEPASSLASERRPAAANHSDASTESIDSIDSIAAPGDIDHDIASSDAADSDPLSASATSEVGHEGSDSAEASSDSQPPNAPAPAGESTPRGRKRRRGNRR